VNVCFLSFTHLIFPIFNAAHLKVDFGHFRFLICPLLKFDIHEILRFSSTLRVLFVSAKSKSRDGCKNNKNDGKKSC